MGVPSRRGSGVHASAVRRADTRSLQRKAVLPVGRAWPWPARLSAAHRRQATTILTSRVISHHFPALQRARDERAAPYSSYGWPAFHKLFRTHRARNSSQGEAACSSLRHQETLRSALHQTRSHPTPTTPHVIFRFTPPATCCGLKSALHEPFRTHSARVYHPECQPTFSG